jgi:pimeloyl-ACP methyl ester carboxylesterase
MSVPFIPRAPMPPTKLFKAMSGERFMYILYFQEPGKAERELEADARRSMRMILYSASGSLPADHKWNFELPKSAGFLTGMTDPPRLPAWLGEDDLSVYATEFARTGFRGGLNWYRNFDRNWELTAPWQGAKVTIPSYFVGGLQDLVVTGPGGTGEGPLVKALPGFVSDLRGKALIPGAGHWNQQEKPAETNAALLGFLKQL